MNQQETILQIILHGGNARSLSMEGISLAKQGHLEEAREKIEEAVEALHLAHRTQTQLIQEEAKGQKTEVSLLLIHAQDHLMNAMTVKDLAKEFIDLYERMGSSVESIEYK
ncbi:MAG: PTS lactose/cellobiose transporter subunit IIA [Thermotaleaceae bacterium]